MRVSEILFKAAEMVAQSEAGEEVAQAPAADATAIPVQAEPEAAPEVETPCDAEADLGPMVSPLQQEHELLKKSQGVDNNVPEFAEEDEGFQSELASMKQAAGIGEEQQGPHNYAEDMKPVSINPRAVAATEANGKQDHRLQQTQRKDR